MKRGADYLEEIEVDMDRGGFRADFERYALDKNKDWQVVDSNGTVGYIPDASDILRGVSRESDEHNIIEVPTENGTALFAAAGFGLSIVEKIEQTSKYNEIASLAKEGYVLRTRQRVYSEPDQQLDEAVRIHNAAQALKPTTESYIKEWSIGKIHEEKIAQLREHPLE